MRRQSLLHTILFLCLLQRTLASVLWSPKTYPNPEENQDICRPSARICDPDKILDDVETSAVAISVSVFEDDHKIVCKNPSTSPEQSGQEAIEIQLAVALVNRMDLSGFDSHQDREEQAAQAFGTHLHNQWGVGMDSPCGGTGILIFLAIRDRAIYISRGDAVKSVLTNHRLDRVISQMKPLLRNENYSAALQTALDNIGMHIKSGDPNLRERIWDGLSETWPFVFFASIVLFFVFQGRIQQRSQREYARVQSKLSELDRNRAQALQGRYQCTSCPICLDDFQTHSEGNKSTTGTDSTSDRVGSDGLPLKLLRCGHVFDQTCWTEWIETGQGNLSQCPVCNQDVGVGTPPSVSDERLSEHNSDAATRQRNGIDVIQEAEQRGWLRSPEYDNDGAIRQRIRIDGAQDALNRYQQERTFRLERMCELHPRFVNHQQMQRWSDPAYDRPLVRDPSFVRSNPHQPQTKPSDHNSGRSFGGGGSSGGRGGRW